MYQYKETSELVEEEETTKLGENAKVLPSHSRNSEVNQSPRRNLKAELCRRYNQLKPERKNEATEDSWIKQYLTIRGKKYYYNSCQCGDYDINDNSPYVYKIQQFFLSFDPSTAVKV